MSGAVKAGEAFVEVLIKGQQKMQQDVQGMAGQVEGLAKNFGGAGGKIMVLNAALEAMGKAWQVVSGTIKMAADVFHSFLSTIRDMAGRIDKIAKAARRMGTDVNFVSEMKYGAELAGASQEKFEMGIKAWQRNLQSFKLGVGEAKATLEALGFAASDFEGKTLEEQLKMIADKLQQTGSTAEAAGIAMRLFGEDGASLLPMLKNGAEGLEKMQAEARLLGLTLTNETGLAAEELQDQFKRVEMFLEGVWNQIFTSMAPFVSGIIDEVIPVLITLRKVGEDMAGAFVEALSPLQQSSFTFGGFLSSLIPVILNVTSNIATMLSIVTEGVANLASTLGSLLAWLPGMSSLGQAMDEASIFLDHVGDGLWDASTVMLKASMSFKENWEKTRDEWARTRTHLDDFSDAAGEWSGEVAKAAKTIQDTFSGEAIRRNASGMQKLQEMNNKLIERLLKQNKDLKVSIDNGVRIVTGLAENIGVI